jgi:protein TonB
MEQNRSITSQEMKGVNAMPYKIFLFTLIVSTLGLVSCGGGEKAPDQTPGQVTSPTVTDQEPDIDQAIEVDEYPTPLTTVNPVYPEAARKSGLEGTVWVKVLVDKKGHVVKTAVTKPADATASLEQAAVEAVKQWTFKPATVKTEPVSIWVTIPFKFKLADK